MADTVQNRRGPKSGLPSLKDAEFGLTTDSKELFVGNNGENIPVMTLKNSTGGPMGIDTAATQGSENLITSGAVFSAMQSAESSISFSVDETLFLENGVLGVNTADVVEADNTLPVTSAAVNVTVGNIEVLLQTI